MSKDESELWRTDLSFGKPKQKAPPRLFSTVFQLACEFARVKAAAHELPELYSDVEAELRALVSANCQLLRDYRQTADFSMTDHCAGTGLSPETLYRIEGGDLDGVSIEDIGVLLDTCASGDCG